MNRLDVLKEALVARDRTIYFCREAETSKDPKAYIKAYVDKDPYGEYPFSDYSIFIEYVEEPMKRPLDYNGDEYVSLQLLPQEKDLIHRPLITVVCYATKYSWRYRDVNLNWYRHPFNPAKLHGDVAMLAGAYAHALWTIYSLAGGDTEMFRSSNMLLEMKRFAPPRSVVIPYSPDTDILMATATLLYSAHFLHSRFVRALESARPIYKPRETINDDPVLYTIENLPPWMADNTPPEFPEFDPDEAYKMWFG